MLTVFKLIHGLQGISLEDADLFLTMSNTRGGGVRLLRDYVMNMTTILFKFRVQKNWSSLPIDIISSNTLSDFKRKLHKHLSECDEIFSNSSIIDFLCRFYLFYSAFILCVCVLSGGY